MSRQDLRTVAALFSLLVAIAGPTSAAEVPFDGGDWVLYDAEVVEHLGRQALMGSAFIPGAAFTDGIIEFDLAVDGSRGYPGVTFRAVDPQHYENIYCRPHVSNRPDALQYTPVFGGVAGWQLYNGPGFTAPVAIPTGEWIHVRLEIAGTRARVFFGDQDTPALVIDDLKHEPRAGSVGIKSARSSSAFFSNVSITRDAALDFGPPPEPAMPPRGLVRHWDLAPPQLATDVELDRYPGSEVLAGWEWTTVEAEPGGLVDIARHVPRHRDGQADVVYARLVLTAKQDERRRFAFGYSDAVRVFCNGELLFAGNSAYRSRDETFSGIVGLEDAVYLPLRPGDNEVLLMVMESFGGWGLMGQDTSDDFLAPGITPVWSKDRGQRIPECVLHDPVRDVLYVSQFFRGGNECLSRLSPAGEVLDREWVTGLVRPTGLALHDGSLWVVDRRHLVQIDPDAGEVVARHEIPGARFPNDVGFDAAGHGYITDTQGHCIYRVANGEITRWFDGDQVSRPNGLCVQGDRIVYGNSGDSRLKAVRVADRQVTVLATLGAGAILDGIRPDGKGGLLFSDFNGRLMRLDADGARTLILDTTASGAYCADFEYVPATGLLVVPGLYDNRLTAYRVTAF
jgi:sugar lactone lactonase YvrE